MGAAAAIAGVVAFTERLGEQSAQIGTIQGIAQGVHIGGGHCRFGPVQHGGHVTGDGAGQGIVAS